MKHFITPTEDLITNFAVAYGCAFLVLIVGTLLISYITEKINSNNNSKK